MLKRRPSNNIRDSRPTKAQKTSAASSSRAGPNPDRTLPVLGPFHPSNEIAFSNIQATLEASDPYEICPGYVGGTVAMTWARTPGGPKRFLISEHGTSKTPMLEVVLRGDKFKPLDEIINHGMIIKLAMRSAEMEAWRAEKRNSLAFKLVYSEGVLLQAANLEGEPMETLDFFEPEIDWIATPPPAQSSSSRVKGAPLTPRRSNSSVASLDHLTDTSSEEDIVESSWKGLSSFGTSLANKSPISQEVKLDSDQHKSQDSRNSNSQRLPTPAVSPQPPPAAQLTKAHQAPSSDADMPDIEEPPKQGGRRVEPDTPPNTLKTTTTPTHLSSPSMDVDIVQSKPVSRMRPSATVKGKGKEREGSTRPPIDPAANLEAGYFCTVGNRYWALKDLRAKDRACFVGIVVQVGEVQRTHMGDYSIHLSLVDPSFDELRDVISVVLFVKSAIKNSLPQIELGQAILLRVIVMENFNGRLLGTGYSDSFRWVAWDAANQDVTYGRAEEGNLCKKFWDATPDDRSYLAKISVWWDTTKRDLTPKVLAASGLVMKEGRRTIAPLANTSTTLALSPPVAATQKFKKLGMMLIKDLKDCKGEEFFDCVIQLLRVDEASNDRVELLVTDWTWHARLRGHSQDEKSGRVLKIAVWNELSQRASKFSPGFFEIRNIKLKMDSNQQLEGHVRGTDERTFQRLGPNHPDVVALLRRRAKVEGDPTCNVFEQFEIARRSVSVVPPKQAQGEISGALSHLVLTQHPNAPVSRLQEVLAVKQMPKKFKVHAQVVDFSPVELRQWVRVTCEVCRKLLPADLVLCPQCPNDDEAKHSLCYRFALRIRDNEGTELTLTAAGDDARDFLIHITPKYIDSQDEMEAFVKYVQPLIGGRDSDNDLVPGPMVDLCLAVTDSGRGPIYTLFGCELQSIL